VERRQEQNWFTSEIYNEAGIPYLKISLLDFGMYFLLTYNDGAEFLIEHSGANIYVTSRKNQSLEDVVTYLVGPLLGFVLRLRTVTCLHASAIVINNKVIAFTGDSGTGKSTTAAAFARLGYKVLSDNMIPIVERGFNFLAQPAYPHLRLRGGAVHALFGSSDALPLIESAQPDWDKRFLDLNDVSYKFQRNPLPIAVIYQLDNRSENNRAPYIEELPSAQQKICLEVNTYKNYMLDSRMKELEYALLGRMLKQIQVRNLVSHTDPAHLYKLCEAVLQDYDELLVPFRK